MALLLRQALATRELLQIMVMVEALFLTTPTGGNTATGTGGTEEGLPGRLEQEVTRLELGLVALVVWLRLHLAMVAQQLQELAARLALFRWTAGNGGVPSGAGTGVAGGAVTITAGNGSLALAGGQAQLAGGVGGATGNGGEVDLTAGAGGATSGNGGAIDINAGAAASTNGTGGAITIDSGLGTGNGLGGGITLTTGGGGVTDVASGALTLVTGAGGGTAASGAVSIKSGDEASAGSGIVTLASGTTISGTSGMCLLNWKRCHLRYCEIPFWNFALVQRCCYY